ncbi:MAG: ABC transporter ATP-binding protein/permease [Alistipes sp.]|nr:ABC transporter ATP-binding protein/permease [Alistipes sp.]
MKRSSFVKWLYRVIGKRKNGIILLTMLQALLGFSSVLFALMLRSVIDAAVSRDRTGFAGSLLLLISISVIQILFRVLLRRYEEQTRSAVENVLKKKLFSELLRKSFASVTAVHSGEWMNRLTSDTVVCANGVTEILPNVLGMMVKMSGALAMIIVLQPEFAYILFPGGMIMIFLTYIFRRSLKKMHRNVQEKDGELRVFMQEYLGDLMIVRSFSAENQVEKEAEEKMSAHREARLQRNRFSNLCNAGFSFAMNGMYLLGLAYCGTGILKGAISYGTLTAILQLISQIQSPFANITGYFPKFYAMAASAERLMEIENFADDCPEDRISSSEVNQFYNEELAEIVLKNVSFSYPSREGFTVLSNVDLQIKKGEFIAFTGNSGCGKSTLLKILMCLYPLESGNISLIKNNGEKETLTSRWSRLFAYVPQENHLVFGTVRDVLSFGSESETPSEDAIKKALKISCSYEFVQALDKGLDAVLGERGSGLSEGQTQRLAVARAVLSGNPILLLDESTSALDEYTEKKLLENLRCMTDKTVLIVTHRPAALDICDKIMKMTENGIETEVKNEKDKL